MIQKIQIQNFKSIVDLSFKIGRITVLIGENGSGKSNILEAIAFAAAASANKLDDEFLYNRGIRVTDKDWMMSAFEARTEPHTARHPVRISVHASDYDRPLDFILHRDAADKWGMGTSLSKDEWESEFADPTFQEELNRRLDKWQEEGILDSIKMPDSMSVEDLRRIVALNLASWKKRQRTPEIAARIALQDFMIYAPENTALRRFEEEGAIKPLGAKGEGLLKLLQIQSTSGDGESFFNQLNSHLRLLGWFGGLHLPTAADEIQGRLRINDHWLPEGSPPFDQRSANEGFLYLLFYFTLLLSPQTPRFLAIDNIDNSLNPRLGAEMMKKINVLAEKSGKQIICTTHNPAILDGLDLEDDNQRLYAVRRDENGHTIVKRVHAPKTKPGESPVRLSEAFVRGIIGGVPDHF